MSMNQLIERIEDSVDSSSLGDSIEELKSAYESAAAAADAALVAWKSAQKSESQFRKLTLDIKTRKMFKRETLLDKYVPMTKLAQDAYLSAHSVMLSAQSAYYASRDASNPKSHAPKKKG